MRPPLLSASGVTITFGGIHAVEAVDFDVPIGSIVSLIGPNGAGKTTFLNSVSGFVRARGSIKYREVELLRQPAHRRAVLGIGRTFQSVQLFPGMTVLENVLTARHVALGGNVVLDMLRFPVATREAAARRYALQILQRVGLEPYAGRRADSLPFGVQKLTGVARALAVDPVLLLLDEPAAGLNRQEAEALGRLIVDLRDDLGLTVLLVEHNMRLVMGISDRVVVMREGKKLTEGLPDEVSADPRVIAAYLGEAAEAPDMDAPGQ